MGIVRYFSQILGIFLTVQCTDMSNLLNVYNLPALLKFLYAHTYYTGLNIHYISENV